MTGKRSYMILRERDIMEDVKINVNTIFYDRHAFIHGTERTGHHGGCKI